MTFCRQGHTLIDNEAESQWDQLVPGTFFDLVVSATTFFGIVDEYTPPTPTTLVCRLYTDPARTILHTSPIATGVPYDVQNFVDYNWTPRDVELVTSKDMGTWTSPPVVVRDEFGFWTGTWTATPMTDETMQFNFDGTYQLFPATADQPLGAAVAGAGLAAGDYVYCIVPVDGSGRLGAGSVRVDVTLGAPGNIQLDWLPNNQVTQWNVYGRTTAGFGLITTLPGATVVFVDDGTLAPNTGLQPPLFSDPAWTVAVPDKTVAISDAGATLAGDTTELGIEKRDDGIVLSDAVGVGTLALNNAGSNFDLTEVESTANTFIGAVIDPNIFTNETLPVEDLPPRIDTYDQHIFIDSDGFKRIVSIDSTTDRTTTIILNTTTGIVTSIIEETSTQTELGRGDMTLEQFLLDSPGGVAPDVGSMSTKITYENFVTQSDGVITGDQTIELNTYQATPLSAGGGLNDLVVWVRNFPVFGAVPRVMQSFDGGVTFPNDYDPETRFVMPPGFFSHGHIHNSSGEGWFVWQLRAVGGGGDFAFAWTNDLSLGTWPFVDGSGRKTGFESLDSWLFTEQSAVLPYIVKLADGRAILYHPYILFSLGNEQVEEHQFFFPASGVFTSLVPGTVNPPTYDILSHIIWPEKNLYLFWREVSSEIELWAADFTTPDSTALTNFRQILGPPAGTDERTQSDSGFVWSPNRIIAYYTIEEFGPFNEVFMIAVNTTGNDGDWVETVVDEFDRVRKMKGAHDDWFPGLNKFVMNDVSELNPPNVATFTSSDGITWVEQDEGDTVFYDNDEFAGGFGQTQKGFGRNAWDGTFRMSIGPDDGVVDKFDSIQRQDGSLVPAGSVLLPAPIAPLVDYDVNDTQWQGSVAQIAVPEDTIFANIRPYIPQRPVTMPLDASPDMPAPFRTRDTSKSSVYDSTRTYDKRTPDGFTMNITVTTFARGGTGSTTATRVENGVFSTENIIYERTPNLPPKTQSYIPFGFPTPKPFG